ncbi:hypothetical protein DFH11DRAFT_668282 [Phellopilus nigrolimitatus]|nr:hypothetical protein DFH11DRAFT_668282 [Phellopilus nigrolimitatus]
MEKYSAYRDPGTGIQPFLSPVPPQGSESLATILRPGLYLLGTIRCILVLLLGLVYFIVVQTVCFLLSPLPFVYKPVTDVLTAVIARLSLLAVGIYWVPVEVVRRKKGRTSVKESWSPKPGDVIVSNWISWLEIAWLAFRFNPTFVLPVTAPIEITASQTPSSSRITPGRKTGTGSAAISPPLQNRAQTKRADVLGFTEVSLLRIISVCGHVPPYGSGTSSALRSFEDVLECAKKARRPIVLFPECTTSNARGLLRFANMFKGVPAPVKDFNVFLMCSRIDPPTALLPTLSLPIPSSHPSINPIPHILSISSSILPHALSIRLLAPSESPSSGTFLLNEVLSGSTFGEDVLSEVCATLISEIGRVKRTGMGWEDKAMFLDFYRGKS